MDMARKTFLSLPRLENRFVPILPHLSATITHPMAINARINGTLSPLNHHNVMTLERDLIISQMLLS